MLGVAERQIMKWFKRGDLKGFREPGTDNPLIPEEHLMRFMLNRCLPRDKRHASGDVVVRSTVLLDVREIVVEISDEDEVLLSLEAAVALRERLGHLIHVNRSSTGGELRIRKQDWPYWECGDVREYEPGEPVYPRVICCCSDGDREAYLDRFLSDEDLQTLPQIVCPHCHAPGPDWVECLKNDCEVTCSSCGAFYCFAMQPVYETSLPTPGR